MGPSSSRAHSPAPRRHTASIGRNIRYGRRMKLAPIIVALALTLASPTVAQSPAQNPGQTPVMTPDTAPGFEFPTARNDWTKRVVMIPMRDGVRLYTVIVEKKGTKDAPILLTRTPYNAKK